MRQSISNGIVLFGLVLGLLMNQGNNKVHLEALLTLTLDRVVEGSIGGIDTLPKTGGFLDQNLFLVGALLFPSRRIHDKKSIKQGMIRIEKLRSELQELAQKYGLLDSRVIKKSQQLDKLIIHHMKRISRRKASSLTMKSEEEQS